MSERAVECWGVYVCKCGDELSPYDIDPESITDEAAPRNDLGNFYCPECEAEYERIEVCPERKLLARRLVTYLKQLAECYRLSGADPDGDSDAHLAKHAVQAVRELREQSDANNLEELELRERAEKQRDELLEAVEAWERGDSGYWKRDDQRLLAAARRIREEGEQHG